MLDSFSSNTITAKARAIYGKRLTAVNYQELARQRTVSDVASYLKNNTYYAAYLSGIDEIQVRRRQLETMLQRSKLQKFVALSHYNFSKKDSFYQYIAMDAEVNILLRAVMLLNSRAGEDIIQNLPTFMQNYVCFDLIALSRAESFSGLLEVVKGTPYREVLTPFLAESGEIDIAGCELALKSFYYKTALDAISKHYSGKMRKELRDAVLLEIELLNLTMIYRLKNFFRLPWEEIRKRLLPFAKRLTPERAGALMEAGNDGEFVERASRLWHIRGLEDVPFTYVEDYAKRIKCLLAKKLMHFASSAPVAFYALMALTQLEIDNLTYIIEGIRYSVPSSEIEKLLILY